MAESNLPPSIFLNMAAVFAVCPLEMPRFQKIKTPAPIHKLSGLGPVLPLWVHKTSRAETLMPPGELES